MKTVFLLMRAGFAVFLLVLPYLAYSQDIRDEKVRREDNYDQSETAIAVDPLNRYRLLATWMDFYPEEWNPYAGYAFSTDGGYNWTWDVLDVEGWPWQCDPSCAFDYNYPQKLDSDLRCI